METSKNYFWAKRTHNVRAEVVGAVFEELEEEFGDVTAENFLDVSRPEESPTHRMFEWDDDRAAENYRLHQARTIINDLRIEVVTEDKSLKIPAYVNVVRKTDGTARYQNAPKAFETAETREIVLERAKRELEIFSVKYERYVEFAGVIAAIREVI